MLEFLLWLCRSPDDSQIVSERAFVVLAVIVLFLFFGAGGTASTFAMVVVIVAGALTILDSVGRIRLHHMPEAATVRFMPSLHLGLVACLVWQLAGWLLLRPGDLGSMTSVGSTLAIIGFVLVVQSMMADRTAKLLRRLLVVIFVAGSVSAAIGIGLYALMLVERGALNLVGLMGTRLVPIGRVNHEIGGATALAAAAIAGWVLLHGAGSRARVLIAIGLIVIISAMVLTQSRGALIALVLGGALAVAVARTPSLGLRKLGLPLAIAVCFALPMALILFEPQVREAICSMQLPLCRSSNRQEIWLGLGERVLQSPWFGWGPHARLEGEVPAHPHNVLLGAAFYFGLPILLPLLLVYGMALFRVAAVPHGLAARFSIPCLAFAAISLATDRPNVFGDLNAHFLYLWLPVALAFCIPAPARVDTRSRA